MGRQAHCGWSLRHKSGCTAVHRLHGASLASGSFCCMHLSACRSVSPQPHWRPRRGLEVLLPLGPNLVGVGVALVVTCIVLQVGLHSKVQLGSAENLLVENGVPVGSAKPERTLSSC